MLNAIAALASAITGDITSVVKWVLKLVQSIYSYFDRQLSALGNDLSDIARSASNLFHQAWNFAVSVYQFALSIADVIIPGVIRWAQNALTDLSNFATSIVRWASSELDSLGKLITSVDHAITSWVVRDIWNPLYTLVSGPIKWIAHEGATAYYLVTHPDKLMSVLSSYLYSAFIDILKRDSRPIGKWLTHVMMSFAGPIADVLEQIISAIL